MCFVLQLINQLILIEQSLKLTSFIHFAKTKSNYVIELKSIIIYIMIIVLFVIIIRALLEYKVLNVIDRAIKLNKQLNFINNFQEMRSHKIQEYKKIKNSPMRSPSPDYACKNRNRTTHEPLNQIKLFAVSSNASPTKFPVLPPQIAKKKTSQMENVKPSDNNFSNSPSAQHEHIHYYPNTAATAKSKINQQFSNPLTAVSAFKTSIEEFDQNHKSQLCQISQMLQKIEQIYQIFILQSQIIVPIDKSSISLSQISQFIQANKKLDQIKQYISNIYDKNGQKSKQIKNLDALNNRIQLFSRDKERKMEIPSNIKDSPIKLAGNQSDSELSILQFSQLQNENKTLRRQIIKLKLEIQGNDKKRNYSASKLEELAHKGKQKISYQKSEELIKRYNMDLVNNLIRQQTNELDDSNLSSTTIKFLKQKILYLQNELQNKMNKILILQKQKIEQISVLKQRLNNANQLLENQMQNYKKVIETQKMKIRDLQNQASDHKLVENKQGNSNPQNILHSVPKRNRLNSQTLNAENDILNLRNVELPKTHRFSMRNALSWDKEEIVSIYDQDHPPEESLYSQAQRVDLHQMFSGKKQIFVKLQKVKQQYESIIQQNNKKYHDDLQRLQKQIKELKQFIINFNIESHQTHSKCQNCKQLNLSIIAKEVQITDLEAQVNILREQVNIEMKQSEKLRQLLNKTGYAQKRKFNEDKKFKRRSGIQKRSKLSQSQSINESENSNENKIQESLVIGSGIKHVCSIDPDNQENKSQ